MSNSDELVYKCCPFNGVICTICQYPVKGSHSRQSIFQSIRYHEQDNNQHATKHDMDSRKAIEKKIIDDMKAIVQSTIYNNDTLNDFLQEKKLFITVTYVKNSYPISVINV